VFTLPIGTNLTISLWLGNTKLCTRGRVVTRFPQVGNGIEFADMRFEDQSQLKRFLAERLAEQQAAVAE
jgi:hypothetical protein